MKTLDRNERQKLWEELESVSQQLGICSPPKLYIATIVEKDNSLLFAEKAEGHSWNRNAWNGFFGHLSRCSGTGYSVGVGHISIRNTDGGVGYTTGNMTSIYYAAGWGIGFYGNTGSVNAGIAVGTSDTAFSVEDYKLDSIVTHGVGAGQLSYGATVVGGGSGVAVYDAGVWTMTISRTFNNGSGDTITVKEIGLMYGTTSGSNTWFYGSSGSQQFMLARDVLGSPVDVPYGAQLTVTYEISMDFSSIDT